MIRGKRRIRTLSELKILDLEELRADLEVEVTRLLLINEKSELVNLVANLLNLVAAEELNPQFKAKMIFPETDLQLMTKGKIHLKIRADRGKNRLYTRTTSGNQAVKIGTNILITILFATKTSNLYSTSEENRIIKAIPTQMTLNSNLCE